MDPYSVPNIKEITEVKKAIDIDILVPYIILLKISRPSSSVPKRCFSEGD